MTNLGDRRTYLGCSELAAACGYSPWTTVHDLWEYKTGRTAPRSRTPKMRRGHDQEIIIARLYKEKTKRIVTRQQEEFIDPARPWLRYHADGIAAYKADPKHPIDVEPGTYGALEFKAPDVRTVLNYIDTGLPTDHVFQGQGGMHCCEKPWIGYAVYDYDNHRAISFDMKRDQKFIDDMLEQVDMFWHYVETDTPPPEAVTPIEIPEVSGELVVLDDELSTALGDLWVQCKGDKILADKQLKEVENEIKAIMNEGNHGLISLGPMLRVSWKPGKSRRWYSGEKALSWVSELCAAIRANNEGKVNKMVYGFRPSNFYTEKPSRQFRPTAQGPAKEELDNVK